MSYNTLFLPPFTQESSDIAQRLAAHLGLPSAIEDTESDWVYFHVPFGWKSVTDMDKSTPNHLEYAIEDANGNQVGRYYIRVSFHTPERGVTHLYEKSLCAYLPTNVPIIRADGSVNGVSNQSGLGIQ